MAFLAATAIAVISVPAAVGTGEAAVPGENGPIAFMSDRAGSTDIWSMQADGSDPVRLTTHPALDGEPVISPDGSKIAFTSFRDGDAEIYVMNADGSDQRQLTHNTAFDQHPEFSPDGQTIVFSSTRTPFFAQLFRMNVDGSAQTQMTDDWSAASPAFSPGGHTIVFTKNVNGNPDIFVMPAGSPCCPKGTQLTDTNGPDLAAGFSPDGGTIAFVSARDGNFEIYTMDPDGSDQTRITNNTTVDNLPVFSPDGTRIAFESRRGPDNNRDIYTMRPDGSDQTPLTTHAAADQWPDWGRAADTTPPPEPTLSDTDPDSPANDSLPRVKGDAEAESTVRLYVGGSCSGEPIATGAASDFASPGLSIEVADDSSNVVRATATDAAGNTSSCSTSEITYVEDSTAPGTTIDSGPEGPTNDSTPTFAFSASEAGATFECRVDGGEFTACSSPHTTEALEDGAHTFAVRARDAAHNVDATPATRTFTVHGRCAFVFVPLPLGLPPACA